MASGEIPTPTSYPPPYSTIDGGAAAEGRPAPYAPYPTSPGGYPAPQMNAPYSGYPTSSAPGAYPPAGNPPSPGYPPHGGYSQGQPGPGFYPIVTTQQPVTVHTTTTTSVNVHAGDRCVGCTGGHIKKHFTACGICCAIFCFPCGIICCLSSRVRSCNKCGAIYV